MGICGGGESAAARRCGAARSGNPEVASASLFRVVGELRPDEIGQSQIQENTILCRHHGHVAQIELLRPSAAAHAAARGRRKGKMARAPHHFTIFALKRRPAAFG